MDEKAKWLEVSLAVDGELAEAVAEVLSRFAPDGVVMQTDVQAWDAEGQGIPTGTTRVCAYLSIDEHIDETRQRLEESMWFLSRIKPLPTLEFSYLQDTNWAESWKQHYQPIPIGQRLMIVPAWLESPDPGRIAVRIEPGMAFGTGTHPSTQLCLEMLEKWFVDRPVFMPTAQSTPRSPHQVSGEGSKKDMGTRVIDIGCGSGILSISALKLGAERALGVDVDERAIQSAKENAQLNDVTERFELGRGSLKEILENSFSMRTAHVVFANILAPVILRLMDEGLKDLIEPDGRLFLSGILVEHARDVEEAVYKHGLKVEQREQVGDWVALSVSPVP
jgi:ribosomal protein L11 methyltransferase